MDTVLKLFPLLLSALVLQGEEACKYAWMAKDLLGPERWSIVVRIENTSAQSNYPRTVYALVFELEGVLWFYTAHDGTQSLSLYIGRVERDKNDIGLLLIALDRGFTHWEELTCDFHSWSSKGRIPNGCFLESLALFRWRRDRGESTLDASLLSYYADSGRGIVGHTVLAFRKGGRVCIIDPDKPEAVVQFRRARLDDPEDIADRLHPNVVSAPRVRSIPLLNGKTGGPAYAMKAPTDHG